MHVIKDNNGNSERNTKRSEVQTKGVFINTQGIRRKK